MGQFIDSDDDKENVFGGLSKNKKINDYFNPTREHNQRGIKQD